MLKTTLAILIVALMMTACGSGPTRTQEPLLQASQSDMQTCPDELPAPLNGSTLDLLTNHVASAKIYHQCKDRHNGLVKWLEKTSEAR